MPKVSVVIAIYNAEPYLSESIGSILEQTLKDIEIIIVNDGSTDSSLLTVEKLTNKDNRVKIINAPHKGAAMSRNAGLEHVKGKYISILDADDIFDKNMLYHMYKQAETYGSELVVCPFRYINQKNATKIGLTIPSEKIDINNFSPLEISESLFQLTSPNAWSKLFKTELIQNNKIKFQNLSSCNDVYFTYYALVLSKKISILNNSYVSYRNCNQTSISSNRGEKWHNIIHALTKLKNTLFIKKQNTIYINSFTRRALRCLEYELQFINSTEEINKFLIESSELTKKIAEINKTSLQIEH